MGNFFGGYTASALRSVLVLLVLLPIAIKYRKLQPLHLKRNWRYMAGMLAASLFTWGPLYYAILHAGVGTTLAVNYGGIVVGTFCFSWLFAGERFTKEKAVSAVLGLAGLAFIFSPTTHGLVLLALAAALVSGLSSGACTVFAKQIRYNATQSTIFLWVASTAANFAMAFASGEPRPAGVLHVQWLYLLCFTAASVAASWLFVDGVKRIDAGAAGVLGLLEIVFGLLFGAVFFGERPGLPTLTGALLIIAAAAIPYMKDYRAGRGARS